MAQHDTGFSSVLDLERRVSQITSLSGVEKKMANRLSVLQSSSGSAVDGSMSPRSARRQTSADALGLRLLPRDEWMLTKQRGADDEANDNNNNDDDGRPQLLKQKSSELARQGSGLLKSALAQVQDDVDKELSKKNAASADGLQRSSLDPPSVRSTIASTLPPILGGGSKRISKRSSTAPVNTSSLDFEKSPSSRNSPPSPAGSSTSSPPLPTRSRISARFILGSPGKRSSTLSDGGRRSSSRASGNDLRAYASENDVLSKDDAHFEVENPMHASAASEEEESQASLSPREGDRRRSVISSAVSAVFGGNNGHRRSLSASSSSAQHARRHSSMDINMIRESAKS